MLHLFDHAARERDRALTVGRGSDLDDFAGREPEDDAAQLRRLPTAAIDGLNGMLEQCHGVLRPFGVGAAALLHVTSSIASRPEFARPSDELFGELDVDRD